MKVSEIMANIVHMAGREESVYRAAGLMKDHDIGCVLVGTADKLEGVVTDRDLVCRAMASGKLLDSMKIADIMSIDPAWCQEDDTVNQAATIMEKKQVRRLPVLNYDHRLVGIVSLGDICTHAPHEISGELIEEVSKPEHMFLAETA